MKKNTLNKLVAVLCLCVIFSCKSRKHMLVERKPDTTTVVKDADLKTPPSITTATSVPASTAVAATKPVVTTKAPLDSYKLDKLRAIRVKQTDFNTFSGKASAKLNIDGNSHDVTLNIRIKKNQQIWVSVTYLLGVEVARALITPDSIKVMNRVETTYLKKPFSYAYQYTSKQINYKTLESLMVGNAVPDLLRDDSTVKPENGNIAIAGNLQDLIYNMVIGSDLRVSQTNMSNSAIKQSMQVSNAAFVQSGTHVIPSQISINSKSGAKNIQADIHYTKVDFDQNLSYQFTVPARFKLVN